MSFRYSKTNSHFRFCLCKECRHKMMGKYSLRVEGQTISVDINKHQQIIMKIAPFFELRCFCTSILIFKVLTFCQVQLQQVL